MENNNFARVPVMEYIEKILQREFNVSLRRTGRTTAIIDKMKDGDVLIVPDAHMGQHVGRMAKEKGKEIFILFAGTHRQLIEVIHTKCNIINGNVFLEHTLIERIVMERLAEMEKMFAMLQVKWDRDPRNPAGAANENGAKS